MWSNIAIVLVVVLLVIVVFSWRRQRVYVEGTFGFFASAANPQAVFPQTGDYAFVVARGDVCYVAEYDRALGRIVPRAYPEFAGRAIVIPCNEAAATIAAAPAPTSAASAAVPLASVSAPATTPSAANANAATLEGIKKRADLALMLVNIDVEKHEPMPVDSASQRLAIITDTTTGVAYVAPVDNAIPAAVWSFTPVMLSYHQRMHLVFGLPSPTRSPFIDVAKYPEWTRKDAALVAAMKNGQFTATLQSARYPALKTPAISFVVNASGIIASIPDVGPIVLAPTPTAMTFRVYGLANSAVNKTTGKLEGYRTLAATNGTTYALSASSRDDEAIAGLLADTDAARWKLIL
jgi:hypothetical protein